MAAGPRQVDQPIQALLVDRGRAVGHVLSGIRVGDRLAVEQHLHLSRPVRGAQHQEHAPRLEAKGDLPKQWPYPVQAWQLGEDQLWVALGGEVVVDYALMLKKRYGPRTWVAGYANDVMAYIPSRRVWQEGGYESGAFVGYGMPAEKWKGDIEERVLAAVDDVVKKVQDESTLPSGARTSKGQIVIPKEIRRRYGIDKATVIHWIQKGEGVLLVPDSEDPIVTAKGMISGSGMLEKLLADRQNDRLKEDGDRNR